ncbi:NAD(P)-binding protein [Patellaria atrata CBS 101060]|uniref:NAD(P)-binding protein n=1 Tax=Patellaria atrata CBS 101060 TaxID=1346257 RepID=A0A9P4S880_9PEZI|nr:NAD(P)-binding protein [Patellaria atrata CBS 101060]
MAETVLLTGASGNIGNVTLIHLLAAGYKVRAVLRSLQKTRAALEAQFPVAMSSGALTFVEIPDMTIPGSFDAATEGVGYAIHVATPLAGSDYVETMAKPAVKVNENVLEAARKAGTVKRIVITGSIVSIVPFKDVREGYTFSEKDWTDIGPEQAAQSIQGGYVYSKVLSERKAWEWIKEKKPGFDLVVLNVPSVIGRSPEPFYTPRPAVIGGNGSLVRELFDVEKVGSLVPFSSDVDDVARLHVLSLNDSVPGNERYLFAHPSLLSPNHLANKIRETYPELRDRVPAAGEDNGLPKPLPTLDTSKADKVFGTAWKGLWESARWAVEDVLAWEKKEGRTVRDLKE